MSNVILFPTQNITAQSEIVTPAPRINPFENRRVPWNGIGVDLNGTETIDEAMAKTGNNWLMEQRDVIVDGQVARDYKATVRVDTGTILGITGKSYRPIQNIDAFSFADVLIQQGATFEKGGSYKGGKKIWFLLKLPSRLYGGEQHDLYMFLMNGNDGQESLFAAFTTIRAMCCNMAHLVSTNASYKVSIQHRGDVNGKLLEAQQIMAGASAYFDGLEHTFEELRKINLTRSEMGQIINGLFPYKEDASERTKRTAIEKRNAITNILLNAPDLQNESMNGLRLVNAITDYESHADPARHTANYAENHLMDLATKPMIADKVVKMLIA